MQGVTSVQSALPHILEQRRVQGFDATQQLSGLYGEVLHPCLRTCVLCLTENYKQGPQLSNILLQNTRIKGEGVVAA